MNEAFDEELLEDIDIGVMLVSKSEELQMTLLLNIVTLCFEHAVTEVEDDGLGAMPKNFYRSVCRKVLL